MRAEPLRPPDWWVYLARCRDGSLYTGITNDLPARIAAHNRGSGSAYTRSRLPVTLVYSEPAADRPAALRREAAIKRMSRDGKLRMVAASSGQKKGRPRGRPR